jgi:LPXTG-motif cell wall-anchored protein
MIFSAKVAENDKLPVCGKNTLINKARATTDFGWKEDTANVTVDKTCVKPKDIKVCDLASKKIITIREDQFDANKHSKNLKDCEAGKITVCELASKKIITIDENKFDASKHSKNMKDCEVTPVVPVTPAELPKTGASDGVTAALALGALVASASYYIASRRLLGN